MIHIDPGHGGSDPGAIVYLNGVEYHEADVAFEISVQLKKQLEAQGAIVYMSHYAVEDAVSYKIRDINAHSPDLTIVIHLNSNENPEPNGAIIYYQNKNGNTESEQVAQSIQNSLIKTKLKSEPDGKWNKIEENFEWRLINKPKYSVVYLETGFISNEKDLKFMSENPDKVAEAIAEGVINYYK